MARRGVVLFVSLARMVLELNTSTQSVSAATLGLEAEPPSFPTRRGMPAWFLAFTFFGRVWSPHPGRELL